MRNRLACLAVMAVFSSAANGADTVDLGSLKVLNEGWQAGWTTVYGAETEFTPITSPAEVPANRRQSNFLTYKIVLPAEYLTRDDAAVFIQSLRYQFEVEFEGQEIYRFGSLSSQSSRMFFGLPIHLISLPKATDSPRSGELVLKVFSPESRIGLDEAPILGKKSDLTARVFLRDLPHLTIGSFLILLALLTAVLFLRSENFKRYIEFSVVCFSYGMFLLLGTDFKALFLKFPLVLDNLQALFVFSIPIFWVRFFHRLFEGRKFTSLKIAEWVCVGLLVACPILGYTAILELPTSLKLFQVIALFTVGSYIYCLRQLSQEKNRTAQSLLVGISIVGASVVNDILLDQGIISTIRLSGLAMLAYVVQFGLITATSIREKFSESAVAQRDMEVAALVQKSFLQNKMVNFGGSRLTVSYIPANEVGGDWYHYTLINHRMLHLHIADITGHGPQAALGACYLKGASDAFYQAKIKSSTDNQGEDLLSFHHFINHHLFTNAKGTSLTLLSLVIDLEKKRFVYLNSAHLPPFTYEHETRTVTPHLDRKGKFLGLCSSVQLPDEVSWESLKPRSIICIHTDGLYEIDPSPKRKKGFSQTQTLFFSDQVIQDTSVHLAVEEMFDLRNGLPLEDDVTVITLQLD